MTTKLAARRLVDRLLGGRLLTVYRRLGRDIVDIVDGARIRYRPYTDIGRCLYYSNAFEKSELAICARQLERESVVIDIGANIGIHSIFFAEIATAGMVFAFEPSLETFGYLRENTQSYENIIPLNLGLSDRASVSDFFVAEDDAYSGLKDTKRKGIEGVRKVVVLRLDDIFRLLKPEVIDFVKIDVEGLEHNVLLGMVWVIENYRPAIFCEIYGGTNSNTSPEKTVDLVVDWGYHAYVVVNGELKAYDHHDDRYYNYLFLPTEKDKQVTHK